ncbi:PH domain-containing protein [Saccharibacillus alkalitolerans]|uniref:PH domain-containing protein n=1 Tax=Saccharibacillus alkalitolerans TaxID=2705290 RepID=A0ABX0EYK4_9BACL|nr:PH domain-containing protein [Saccharibacillus alkalitolerans]NGZ73821.1 PH domain-containing protein [Saccharibacillus alkalitolerans]
MIYCTNCGAPCPDDAHFCGKCGKPLHAAAGTSEGQRQRARAELPDERSEKTLWEGRPSDLGDQIRTGLLMNNVRYKITSQRLIVTTGLVGKKTEEIELVRVKDISLEKTVMDRMMGVGTILVHSSDPTAPEVRLEDVKEAEKVKDLLRAAVREEKERYGTRYREDL